MEPTSLPEGAYMGWKTGNIRPPTLRCLCGFTSPNSDEVISHVRLSDDDQDHELQEEWK